MLLLCVTRVNALVFTSPVRVRRDDSSLVTVELRVFTRAREALPPPLPPLEPEPLANCFTISSVTLAMVTASLLLSLLS